MKTSKIVDAMGYIDDDLITASIDYKPRKIKMKWIPYAAAAACAACFCILAVRISVFDPVVSSSTGNAGNTMSEVLNHSMGLGDISTGNGELNAGGTASGDTAGGALSGIGTTGTTPVDKPGSGQPGDPANSSGENAGTSYGEKPSSSKPTYDGVFEGVDGGFSGASMSYDGVMEMINSPFQKENGIFLDSFYLVETIRALPIEESKQLNGWGPVCEGKTVYEVKLLKDLIGGEEISRTEKILVANGTVEWQKDGDPVYATGEKFTVALTKPQEGYDFLHTPSSITFRYDVVDDENGDITLYSRGSELDKLKLPTSEDITETVITSTTLNPAKHTQKLDLDALADFLREDWKARGVSSHFDNTQDNTNTSQAAPVEEKPPVGSSPNAYRSTKPVTFSTAKEQVKFTEVKEVSGENFVGYELDYVMPSETLIALRYVYTDGEVSVMDNSGDCGVIKISPEYDEKIERDGMIFWKAYLSEPPTIFYISESEVAYIATFKSDADLSKAIETIKSLI